MQRRRVAVLASGRGSNFRALARDLAPPDAPGEIVLLVSDDPGAAALDHARSSGIDTAVLDCAGRRAGRMGRAAVDALLEALEAARVELVVLAGFMRILPPRFIASHTGRILNIHPSLLPAFPGLDAQGQALDRGVKVAGCTVHLVDEGTDTGPIVLQATVPVEPDDDRDALAQRILREEHRILPLAVRLHCEGRLGVEGRRVRILRQPPR